MIFGAKAFLILLFGIFAFINIDTTEAIKLLIRYLRKEVI
ncbi:hypothetical protein HMPREF1567_2401 [Providencia alcalifaciens PAL-2]|nr:hypothetical protein HMPREF1568_2849 [Providencia alcalifaciens PAL-3]ETT04513.1 hypothetical protein HMPREF1562_2361 [Providencia alcalifaciens F90-2004]EUC96840.1 hypothetical protein HMPREF1567_2401 [Providencia alcalifaciens PAL-2]EUD00437.1 hypothetical protein HMPREF1566_1669 [Providencia alcalifaciens PAL-1]